MSETVNLKLKKHDNVTTNTNQFDIQNYMNGNWDKIDEATGDLQLNKADKTELEKLQEEKALLEKDLLANQITAIAEGNSLALTDCSSARLVDFGVEGNSYQANYSNKNIFNEAEFTREGVGWYSYNNITGLTMLKVDGRNYDNVGFKIIVEPNTTYYFKVSNFINLSKLAISQFTSSGTFLAIKNITENSSLTMASNTGYIKIRPVIAEGKVYPINIGHIMISKEDIPYQAYNTPSLDYPSEIKSCGDNINLFNKDNSTIELGTINENGVFADSSIRIRVYNISVESNKDITISSSNKDLQIVPYFYSSDNNFISYNSGWKTMPYTCKIPQNASILKLLFKNSTENITIEDIIKLKIEEGTIATPYSPYNQRSINIVKSNKNFFNKNDTVQGYLNSDGTINTTSIENRTSNYILVKPNSSYIRTTINGVTYYNEDKKVINYVWTKKFSTPNNCKYIRITVPTNNLETEQLEEGTETTSYIEHQDQVYTVPAQKPFRAIGNIRDKFIKQNGKWYEEHKIGESNQTSGYFIKTKTAEEEKNIATAYYSIIAIQNGNSNNKAKNNILCNCFRNLCNANDMWVWRFDEGISLDTNPRIRIKKERIDGYNDDLTDIEKGTLIKNYLDTLNIIIDYQLKTPELIECTAEQSKILDKIFNDENYKGLTYIYSTDEVQPNLKATYSKDLNTIITKINDAIIAEGSV